MRFSATEVQRAKRERQATRVVNVQCRRCGTKWWIRAREIAAAVPDRAFIDIPDDFPGRDELLRAEVRTLQGVRALSDLTSVPGIGPATAKRINARLDAVTNEAVA